MNYDAYNHIYGCLLRVVSALIKINYKGKIHELPAIEMTGILP